MIYEVKGEFDDECLRLRKERADLQIVTGQIKEIGMRTDLNLEKALEDMQRIHLWNQKVKDILTLSTYIERQDELDKSSISLIGMKENKELPVAQAGIPESPK